jgi:hypothetical protein
VSASCPYAESVTDELDNYERRAEQTLALEGGSPPEMLERMQELDAERTLPDAELARQARWWVSQFPEPDGVRRGFFERFSDDGAIIDGVRWTFAHDTVQMQRRTFNPLSMYLGWVISPARGRWGNAFDVSSYLDGRSLSKRQRARLVGFIHAAPQLKERLEACANDRVRRAAVKRLAKLPGERDEADARREENLEVLSNSAIEAARAEPSPATRIAILSRVKVPVERKEDALYLLGLAHLEIAGRQKGDGRLDHARVAAASLEQAIDRPDVTERQQAIYGLFSAKLMSGDKDGAARVLTENPLDFGLFSFEQTVIVNSFLESQQPRNAQRKPAQISAPKAHAPSGELGR